MKLYDAIGIGFGPSNIAVAVAAQELHPELDICFLEQAEHTQWQSGMQLPGADIQNNPLRDFVTPRNPKSHYTFVNFLFEHDRLFEHLNLGLEHPLRIEFEQYIAWVASFFKDIVRYKHRVEQVSLRTADADGESVYEVKTSCGKRFLGRSLIVAPGRTPNIPECFRNVSTENWTHLTDMLPFLERFDSRPSFPRRIGVLGGSQSAIEILLYLSDRYPDAELTCIHRNYSFKQKDTSPFTEEVYFPEFTDKYFHASDKGKEKLRSDIYLSNYSSVDRDVLDELYRRIYHLKIQGYRPIRIIDNSAVNFVSETERGLSLQLVSTIDRDESELEIDAAILATGFSDIGIGEKLERVPGVLEALCAQLGSDEEPLQVGRDYRVQFAGRECKLPHNPCYLNGLCESSHGLGDAGSFSLLSIRSETIVRSLKKVLAGQKITRVT